jgi:POT family proton-dependent oligopeptide transporter
VEIDVSEQPPVVDHRPQILGHPRGLFFLSGSEAWERFSYYGMQTLLALYMAKELLLPGHVEHVIGFPAFRVFLGHLFGAYTDTAIAGGVTGLYSTVVYVTPVLGGLLADTLLGKKATVIFGGLIMALGHFLMAFDVSFLFALLCLVVGTGCFKGNIAAQVGALYSPGDKRRADAFQIFYLGINGGVIAAPLVCGTLGEKVAFHWGFAAAGVGMVIGLLIYLWGGKEIGGGKLVRRTAGGEQRPTLQPGDGKAIVVLGLLLPVLAVGAVGNQEIFNGYLLWADKHAHLVFFGQVMPTTWLILVDTICSVSFLFLTVVFWRLWSKRFKEPSEVTKIAIGSLISVTGLLSLAGAAATEAATGQKFGVGWLLTFHLLNSIGFANVFPVSLALYSRVAPPAIQSTIISIFYLNLAAANFMTGWLSGLLDKIPATEFWLIHAVCVGGAGVVFFIAKAFLGDVLAPKGVDPVAETA